MAGKLYCWLRRCITFPYSFPHWLWYVYRKRQTAGLLISLTKVTLRSQAHCFVRYSRYLLALWGFNGHYIGSLKGPVTRNPATGCLHSLGQRPGLDWSLQSMACVLKSHFFHVLSGGYLITFCLSFHWVKWTNNVAYYTVHQINCNKAMETQHLQWRLLFPCWWNGSCWVDFNQ